MFLSMTFTVDNKFSYLKIERKNRQPPFKLEKSFGYNLIANLNSKLNPNRWSDF